MNPQNKWLKITGFVLHALMAALFIFAGAMKVGGFMPADQVQKMAEFGIGDKLVLIGVGELVAAVLLVLPWTSPLGTLVTSGLWGGIISFNMSHGQDFIFPSVLLAVLWIAGYWRGSVPLLFLNTSKVPSPAAN
jgi:uncharacterized membrane protein YphA (DoxX/SURF4 family)